MAAGIIPDAACAAANRGREEAAAEAARIASSKRAFLGRLEEAFARYRAYCKAHRGTDFNRFAEFRGTIPAELRSDREV